MARKTTSRTYPTPARMESIRHNGKRAGISLPKGCGIWWPTTKDTPRQCSIPRDTSLDPQLVWKGISMEGSGLMAAASKHHNLSEEPTRCCSVTPKTSEMATPQHIVVLKSFVPITNRARSVMQGSRTGFQPVIPVGWASSPSIKWDGQDAHPTKT